MEMLSESKNLFLNTVHMAKAHSQLHESMGKNGVIVEQA
jgi:hypothetical protein